MLQNVEFIQSFVEEAKIHVESIESELLQMNVENISAETINVIFRAVHSIKGTAGFFNLSKIVELSHTMENIFGECRAGRFKITAGMIDLLISCNDCLKSMVDDVMSSENFDITEPLKLLSSIQAGNVPVRNSGGEKVREGEACGFSIPSARLEQISDWIRHGHRLYNLKLWLYGDLIKKELGPAQLFNEIKSIGNIVEGRFELDELQNAAEARIDDVCISCTFTSVLERDLLTGALGIPNDSLSEITLTEKLPERQPERQAENRGPVQGAGIEKLPALKEQEPAALKGQNAAVEDSIRVHVNLLNDLLNLASEMVLGRNQLLRAMESHRKSIAGIEPILQNIDHITTEIQEKIMQTRMQPVANVFSKFPRIIRDLSKKLGKDIDLKLEGTDVELDKSIIEALTDPLTHLVRNAADHGLELPLEREAAGKARIGSIVMKAYHEGGYVNIDIIDDGKGINTDKIREAAVEKGFVSKSEAVLLGEQEILQLLFKPGFSTAEKVTDVSGRGVGMDVVKTNIEKLGGTIEIFSMIRKGTTFRLLLPLTLAIIPSLIVETENQKFALPQVNLQEIVRIKANDASRKVEFINNAEVLRLRGKLLPVIHLADVVGLVRTYADPVTGERKKEKRKNLFDLRNQIAENTVPLENYSREAEQRRNNNTLKILVVKIGSRRLGLAVDTIFCSEEILVKPLPSYIKDCKCYSGVTIMGDGKTAMILDPGGIIDKASLRFTEGHDEKRERDIIDENEGMREQQNLLVFKCSGPETLAVDLSMVSRVEEINPEAIEKIGDKEYINYRGSSLRVIRPEDFLPLNKVTGTKSRLYVIIPKLVNFPIGILIEKIHDTVHTEVKLMYEAIKAKGFVGSMILDNRIMILVNMYELFEIADPVHYSIDSKDRQGERKSILVVEDTPFFEKLEKDYLEVAGYNVITARNGKEALKVLQENRIDAVVSDIHMPVMDGLELIRRIRGNKELSGLPVIAVTSMTGDLQKKAGLEAGFDYYEFKLDRGRMLNALEQAIKKGRNDK